MKVQYVPPHDVDCSELQKTEGGCEFTPIASGKKFPLGYLVVNDPQGNEFRHRLFLLPSGNIQGEQVQTRQGSATPTASIPPTA